MKWNISIEWTATVCCVGDCAERVRIGLATTDSECCGAHQQEQQRRVVVVCLLFLFLLLSCRRRSRHFQSLLLSLRETERTKPNPDDEGGREKSDRPSVALHCKWFARTKTLLASLRVGMQHATCNVCLAGVERNNSGRMKRWKRGLKTSKSRAQNQATHKVPDVTVVLSKPSEKWSYTRRRKAKYRIKRQCRHRRTASGQMKREAEDEVKTLTRRDDPWSEQVQTLAVRMFSVNCGLNGNEENERTEMTSAAFSVSIAITQIWSNFITMFNHFSWNILENEVFYHIFVRQRWPFDLWPTHKRFFCIDNQDINSRPRHVGSL